MKQVKCTEQPEVAGEDMLIDRNLRHIYKVTLMLRGFGSCGLWRCDSSGATDELDDILRSARTRTYNGYLAISLFHLLAKNTYSDSKSRDDIVLRTWKMSSSSHGHTRKHRFNRMIQRLIFTYNQTNSVRLNDLAVCYRKSTVALMIYTNKCYYHKPAYLMFRSTPDINLYSKMRHDLRELTMVS